MSEIEAKCSDCAAGTGRGVKKCGEKEKRVNLWFREDK